MPHSTPVPPEVVRKWQEIVDLTAEILHVPSALIMRVEPPNIKVFVSSETKGILTSGTKRHPSIQDFIAKP
jgi:hypothetical protein